MLPASIITWFRTIISSLPETIAFLSHLIELYKKKQLQDWSEDLERATRKAENAKTDQEKIEAARALSGVISRL